MSLPKKSYAFWWNKLSCNNIYLSEKKKYQCSFLLKFLRWTCWIIASETVHVHQSSSINQTGAAHVLRAAAEPEAARSEPERTRDLIHLEAQRPAVSCWHVANAQRIKHVHKQGLSSSVPVRMHAAVSRHHLQNFARGLKLTSLEGPWNKTTLLFLLLLLLFRDVKRIMTQKWKFSFTDPHVFPNPFFLLHNLLQFQSVCINKCSEPTW